MFDIESCWTSWKKDVHLPNWWSVACESTFNVSRSLWDNNHSSVHEKKPSIFQSWDEHFCTKRHDIQSQRRLVGQQPQLLTMKTMTVTAESILCCKEESPIGFEIRNLERFASEFLVKYPLVEGIFFWALGILCLTETMSNPRDIKPYQALEKGAAATAQVNSAHRIHLSSLRMYIIACKNYSYQLPTGSRTRNWDAILGVHRSLLLPRAEGWN